MIPRAPVRLLVVNDYPVVSAGVAAMLRPHRDRVAVVESGWNGRDEPPEVDVVLYDTYAALPQDESQVYDAFRGTGARVVLYSWPFEEPRLERALRAGASGFVSKELAPERLVHALERVNGGERVVERPPSGRRRAAEHGAWPGRPQELSLRESEIVALIARGLSNQEIAEQTFLSINSVKTYVRTAYRKMGVSTRAQAVLWAVTHGFMPGGGPVAEPAPSEPS
jgi:two-component system, NarL family, response regulator LiaR